MAQSHQAPEKGFVSQWSVLRQFAVSVIGCVLINFLPVVLFLFLAVPLRAAPPDRQLVRLYPKSKAQIQEWVDSGLDIWEVRDGAVLASVSGSRLGAFARAGVRFDAMPQMGMPAFPACYRTYEEMLVFFHEMQGRYSDLFRLYNIGPSWETEQSRANRWVYAVRLRSEEGPEERPKVLILAEHHAREIVTVEVALELIEALLRGYGTSAEATWLLRNREIWVVPMVNPDGYVRVEALEDWRKNTNDSGGCAGGEPPNSDGVDLNRNYGYEWGREVGSSGEPCHLTYRGTGPFSEPETVAIRDLVRREGFGVLLSLHSYGDLVLYPWGYTYERAPDWAGLKALADRLGRETGYLVVQSFGVGYLSSGDTTDWAYGELGVPAFTLEIGGMEDGFFWPGCEKREELVTEVQGALVYAAQAADAPYEHANGPDITSLTVQADRQWSVWVEADDRWAGDDAVAGIELFVGSIGDRGTGLWVPAVDGAYDQHHEWGFVQFDPSYLDDNSDLLVAVATDRYGNRGVPGVVWLPTLQAPSEPSPTTTPTPAVTPPAVVPTMTPSIPPVRPTATVAPPKPTIPPPPPTPPSPTPTPTPPQVSAGSITRVYFPFFQPGR